MQPGQFRDLNSISFFVAVGLAAVRRSGPEVVQYPQYPQYPQFPARSVVSVHSVEDPRFRLARDVAVRTGFRDH